MVSLVGKKSIHEIVVRTSNHLLEAIQVTNLLETAMLGKTGVSKTRTEFLNHPCFIFITPVFRGECQVYEQTYDSYYRSCSFCRFYFLL